MIKKVMLSLDDNILIKVDEMAKELGLNRSAFITTALGEYIQQKKTANNIANNLIQTLMNNDEITQALKEKIIKNE